MAEQEIQLDQETIDNLREKAKGSLFLFAKGILQYDWLTPEIHGPICRQLEQYEQNTRMKFVLPRGWLKSTLCSIAYPMWRAVKNPNIRCLIVQNSHTNACKKLNEIRGQIQENQLFRALFPDLLPTSKSTWKADSLCLTRRKNLPESTFEAAGTNTGVVSRHYELIIEDDTVAPDLDDLGEDNLAPTKDDVVQAIGWHRLASPLLTNPQTDQILVVGTRWFEKDLMSWIEDNEPHYVTVTRACRENEDGEPDERGDITYPERFGDSVLQELKNNLGPYMFSCLYLNKPVRSEDMVFKPEWFRDFDSTTSFNNLVCYTTVDPATDPEQAKSRDIDYSVVLTTGKDLSTGYIYVLEYTRERCSPGAIVSHIFDHVQRWKPVEVGFEDVAFQKSLSYWIKERMRSTGTFFHLRAMSPGRKSKFSRVSLLQPVFASGSIFLRPTMKELKHELLTFPYGSHDDIADCLAMQLEMWRMTKSKAKRLQQRDPDALLFDNAVEELRGDNEVPPGSVLDLLETGTAA